MPHEGRIDYVEPRLDPSTGTLRVRAIFSNENRLLVSGLFGRVRVRLGEKKALLVPELAVGIGQAGRFVLVVNDDNLVEQRLVETGQLEGTLRVIKNGLKPDERVVINAIQRATPGAKVTPKKTSIEPVPQKPGSTNPSSGK
jgi:RND family efflux transporter MFP subunit